MSIELHSDSERNADLQRIGHTLADKLVSESDVEASLTRCQRRLRMIDVTGVGSFVVFIFSIFGTFFAVKYGRSGSIDLALFFIALAAPVIVLLSFPAHTMMLDNVQMHLPLSGKPSFCILVRNLASNSSAATDYIRSVTATGRQLRIFDIAAINRVVALENEHHAKNEGAQACAALHRI